MKCTMQRQDLSWLLHLWISTAATTNPFGSTLPRSPEQIDLHVLFVNGFYIRCLSWHNSCIYSGLHDQQKEDTQKAPHWSCISGLSQQRIYLKTPDSRHPPKTDELATSEVMSTQCHGNSITFHMWTVGACTRTGDPSIIRHPPHQLPLHFQNNTLFL